VLLVVALLPLQGVLGVRSAAAAPGSLMMSTTGTRANPKALQGATVSGSVYIFVKVDRPVLRVDFWVDHAAEGPPYKSEKAPPYDLAGTALDGKANPFDTTKLTNTTHIVRASVFYLDGAVEALSGQFTVKNGAPPSTTTSTTGRPPTSTTTTTTGGPPPLTGYPDATNTGVQPGVTLTTIDGSVIIDEESAAWLPGSGTAADPYVLQNY
jgi:hypothetical protein